VCEPLALLSSRNSVARKKLKTFPSFSSELNLTGASGWGLLATRLLQAHSQVSPRLPHQGRETTKKKKPVVVPATARVVRAGQIGEKNSVSIKSEREHGLKGKWQRKVKIRVSSWGEKHSGTLDRLPHCGRGQWGAEDSLEDASEWGGETSLEYFVLRYPP